MIIACAEAAWEAQHLAKVCRRCVLLVAARHGYHQRRTRNRGASVQSAGRLPGHKPARYLQRSLMKALIMNTQCCIMEPVRRHTAVWLHGSSTAS